MAKVTLWVPDALYRELYDLQAPGDNWSAWFQGTARRKLRARREGTSPERSGTSPGTSPRKATAGRGRTRSPRNVTHETT